MRVLVVDDNELMLSTVTATLSDAGYEVTPARGGEEALQILSRDSAESAHRLVVTDWMMPGVNGLDLCRAVRQRKSADYVYIVLLTGNDGSTQRLQGLAAGADDFITKPFDPAELVARVKTGERILSAELAELRGEITRRRRGEEELRARTRQQAVIAQLGQRALLGCDVDAMMDEAAAGVAQALDVELSGIFKLLIGQKTLLLRAGFGWKTGLAGAVTISSDPNTQAGKSLIDRKPVIAEHLNDAPGFVVPDLLKQHGAASGLTVVIHGLERPFGLLAVYSTQPHAFSAHDVNFVQSVANVLATSIERTLAEKQLERSNGELERSNRKLSALFDTATRFVDNVSHEFRTPLTVIKGYAEAMNEGLAGPTTDDQKEFIGFILDRTRDLGQMVDDLLDSSKLRAGTLRIDRRSHSIEEILAPVRPMLRAKAASNKIELIEDLCAGLPNVFADAEKVGRVIVNLVVNAIKFSPENSRVTLWSRPDVGGGAIFGVTDQGPGISPDNMEVIFQRFKQLGDAQTTSKGFGLGLDIARELVGLNLGTMDVKSEPLRGSTFSFALPPVDPKIILERYFEYLALLTNVEGTLVLLRVGDALDNPIDDEQRGFISTNVRAADLILENRDHRGFLVIGCSADPQRMQQRLQEAARAHEAELGPARSPRQWSIELIGSWPYPNANAQAGERIIDALRNDLAAEVLHV